MSIGFGLLLKRPLDSVSRSYGSTSGARHPLGKFEILAVAFMLLHPDGFAQSPLVLDAQIRAGAAIERNIEASRPDIYIFKLEARQFFHAVLEQGKADLSVTFFGPEDRAVRTVDTRWSGAEPASFEAPANGSYRMEVRNVLPTKKSLELHAESISGPAKCCGRRKATLGGIGLHKYQILDCCQYARSQRKGISPMRNGFATLARCGRPRG